MVIYNPIGCGFLLLGMIPFWALRFFVSEQSIVATLVAPLLAALIAGGIDLLYRMKRAPIETHTDEEGKLVEEIPEMATHPMPTRLLHPRAGGSFFFIPLWVICGLATVMIVMNARSP